MASQPAAFPDDAKIRSWNEYLKDPQVLDTNLILNGSMLFRGQGDADWGLVPSLVRALRQVPERMTNDKALNIEETAQEEFAAQAHLYLSMAILNSVPTIVHWWMHMQHYSAPTRLLDWTYSPFVAAYFACCDHPNKDGAVWALDINAGHFEMPKGFEDSATPEERNRLNKMFTSAEAPPRLHFINMGLRNERMIAQQGVFMLSENVQNTHEQILFSLRKEPDNAARIRKLRIPAEQKREFLRQLHVMNINARSLFPGLDGLGKSIGEMIVLTTMWKME
jgi:hypothetical protein